jgi:hypothetical protein
MGLHATVCSIYVHIIQIHEDSLTHSFATLEMKGKNSASLWKNMILIPFDVIQMCKANAVIRKLLKFRLKNENLDRNQDCLAYFPKVGLCTLHPFCVSVNSPPPY